MARALLTLARAGVGYASRALPAGSVAYVEIAGKAIIAPEPAQMEPQARAAAVDAFRKELQSALADAGFPASADPARINRPLTVLLLTLLIIINTITYGPLAAYLVELFPARVRYTGASVAFNVGGVIGGGFTPVVAASLAGQGLHLVGIYLSAAAALSFLALLLLRKPALD